MSEDDWWPAWFRKRPGFRRFWDIDRIFKDMEDIFEREFQELSRIAPKDLVRERKLPDGRTVREWGPFVYGYSVKIGSDGKPQIREFGNVKPRTRMGKPRIDIRDQREPLVDVLQDNGDVKVFAELPGVEKEDIKLFGTETNLTISVETSKRKYYKEVELPTRVDPKQAKSSYKNGVLEITLPKQREEIQKGESINIE